ncbi:MAG: hypothetical protein R2713_24095 [Ilumatobacteraceae bacterium]
MPIDTLHRATVELQQIGATRGEVGHRAQATTSRPDNSAIAAGSCTGSAHRRSTVVRIDGADRDGRLARRAAARKLQHCGTVGPGDDASITIGSRPTGVIELDDRRDRGPDRLHQRERPVVAAAVVTVIVDPTACPNGVIHADVPTPSNAGGVRPAPRESSV